MEGMEEALSTKLDASSKVKGLLRISFVDIIFLSKANVAAA
ncbi:MAG: hypothetical protein HY929_04395 [Euryarchaeota archaeon]|nr:hypothetical protein [Euryarchaeota archaeon]